MSEYNYIYEDESWYQDVMESYNEYAQNASETW